MTILFAILATLWWLAIWGIFEILTKNYTDKQKLIIYIFMLGLILCIIAFFPRILDHL